MVLFFVWKNGKIANKCNALVVGQITCWLVFVFSKFEKWKNGKMEKLEHNIIFGIIDHLIIKKYPARTTRFGACPGLYDLVLLVVYKKKYFGITAIYGVFDFSMLACLPGWCRWI